MASIIAICIVILRFLLIEFLHMSEVAATTLMTIGQVVAGSIGAIMVIVQLSRESDAQEDQASIQEAQFILAYNQAFIQDQNITLFKNVLAEHHNKRIKLYEKYQFKKLV